MGHARNSVAIAIRRLQLALLLGAGVYGLVSCEAVPRHATPPRFDPPARAAADDGDEPERFIAKLERAAAVPPEAVPAAGAGAGAGRAAGAGKRTAKPLGITLGSCAKARCPLLFSFDRPMVKRARAGLGRRVAVRFEPPQRGRFRWLSPRKLRFTPGRRAFLWGHAIKAIVERAVPLGRRKNALAEPWRRSLRVPQLWVANKVASWPVRPGRPRFVALLNHYGKDLGWGALFLLYDQPVSPARVARQLRLERDGKRLAARVFRPRSIARVWSGKVDLRHVVALRPRRMPADGTELALAVPSWQARGKLRHTRHRLTVSTTFEVHRYLLARRRQRGRAPLRATWVVEFNHGVSAAELRRKLRVWPRPKDLQVRTWGTEARITARLAPGRRYRLVVPRGLRDQLGNRLRRGFTSRVRAQDLEPRLDSPPVLTLEAALARLPLRTLNVARVAAQARPVRSPADFVRALAAHPARCSAVGGAGAVGRRAQLKPRARLNRRFTGALALGKSAARGLYCVELTATARGSEAARPLRRTVLAQLTDLGVTAKVFSKGVVAWVTRLSDARPVKGALVSLLDDKGRRVARGRTDGRGLVQLRGTGRVTRPGGVASRAYLVAERGSDAALLQLTDKQLAQPWQFGLDGDTRGAAPLAALLFSDRGVYRPGETVHIKALVRDRSTLRPAAARQLQLTVDDARGEQLLARKLRLDGFGGGAVDLKLPAHAEVGEYVVRARQGAKGAPASYRFRVEEYRVPSFEVKVTRREPWAARRAARALVSARYLHGGALAGREVRYRVLAEPAKMRVPRLPRFVFGRKASRQAARQLVKSGRGKLDGSGQLVVSFAPQRRRPTRYTVEASVEDVDRQVYAGRLSQVVHPTRTYVGIRPPTTRVVAAGSKLELPIVAVSPGGAPRAGVAVTALLQQVDYHTSARVSGAHGVQRRSRAVPRVIRACRRRTRRRPVTCTFRLPRAGRYRVLVRTRGRRSTTPSVGFAITAPGRRSIAWPRFDHERIEIVTDKARYAPGDVARLMIQTPFRRARGLLTLERDGVIEQRLFQIKGNAPVLRVALAKRHAPNVFASVVLLRGRVHRRRDALGFETGAPAFRLGATVLKVSGAHHRLGLKVSPRRPVAHPGQRVTIDLQLQRRAGRRRASATVAVVDEAVLGLTAFRTPDPLRALFAPRPLAVRTASSRLDLPHARRARYEAIFPGGGGDYGGDGDRRRGEGRGGRRVPLAMRRLFKSTAYWKAAVPIGAGGRASVSFRLPDNVTSYRVMAIVADDGARVGAAEARLVVRKPLMVKAVLPRFLLPGDRLRVAALVFNGTARPRRVEVAAAARQLQLSGGRRRSVTVAAGGTAKVAFDATVSGRRGVATVRFAARSGKHRDGVERRLPINNPGTRRKQVATSVVSGSGALSVTLPATRVAGSARVELLASRSSLTRLKGAVDYLMGYPHGCIEQTTSTAYPLVVLEELLPEIGVTVDKALLKKYAKAGVKRLLSFQTPSGGLAYWPGSDKPHAFGTAFGLTALIAAKARGYEVPAAALRRMADYLQAALARGKISGEMPHGGIPDADTRALFVMTLGRLGRPQPAMINTLWRARAKLTGFGLSFLAVAVNELKRADRSLLKPILAEVRRRAKETAREAYFERKSTGGGWAMRSPLRTHGSALIAFAGAAGGGGISGKLLNGLLARQRGGLWGNTQENVFGVMGVVNAVRRGRKGVARPKLRGRLNGVALGGRSWRRLKGSTVLARLAEGKALRLPRRGAAPLRLKLAGGGAMPLHVTLRADYEVKLDAKARAARSSGFTVARRYETLAGKALAAGAIPLGSLVRVRIAVKTKKKHNYVALTDRLPAGLEALNSRLATTERVGAGELDAALARGLRVLSHDEIRDDRVLFYADELPAGSYAFSYVARATTPGTFLRPAARAEAMYQPRRSGRTVVDKVRVR